jgi:methanethiol S-methyltransferase
VIEYLNFMCLLFSTILFVQFYNMSVSPAFFEKQRGESAYKRCGFLRIWAMVFMFIACANYVLFCFYPITFDGFIPRYFPWSWWISIGIALFISIPSLIIMIKGMADAGSEVAFPDKAHEMYKGIYKKIRHPQAAGEVFLFLVIAFFCHSPFLVIYSIIWFPLYYILSLAEEKDLVLRYKDAYIQYQKDVGMFWPRKPKKNN